MVLVKGVIHVMELGIIVNPVIQQVKTINVMEQESAKLAMVLENIVRNVMGMVNVISVIMETVINVRAKEH
jgi:hypothetical protein